MKKITYILTLLTLCCVISCEEIDRYPRGLQSTGTFFASETDALEALAGIYDNLQNWAFYTAKLDGMTNNSFERGMSNFGLVARLSHNPTSGPQSTIWNTAYKGVQRSNYLINNVDKIPSAPEVISILKAEGRLLRAYWYHVLVSYFGDVPYYTEQLTVEELNNIERTPRATVITNILDDLEAAIAVLPVNPGDTYRASKGAALGIKTRVQLYEKNWSGVIEAYNAWNAIKDEAGYGLDADYRNMFLAAGENGPEAIFQVNFVGEGIDNLSQYHVPQVNWRDYREVQPLLSFILDHEVVGDTDPEDPFIGRDPRAAFNIADEEVTDGTAISETGYMIRKMTEDVPRGTPYDQLKGDNIMLVRYSDMRMMFAEAENELNGPSAAVYDVIDEIRTRPTVGLPVIDRAVINNKDKLRDAIYSERKFEFAYEGLWYHDLKRRDDAYIKAQMSLVTEDNRLTSFESQGTDKYRLLPIPRNEMDINSSLSQNTGY
ncbi:MAG: RagB/SusD family nutrient uptake outer membrane protein [Bacteroidota bacterium]